MAIKLTRSPGRKNDLHEQFYSLIDEMQHMNEAKLAEILLTLVASKNRLKPARRLFLAASEGRHIV